MISVHRTAWPEYAYQLLGMWVLSAERNALPGIPGEVSLSVDVGSERHSGQIATDCYWQRNSSSLEIDDM